MKIVAHSAAGLFYAVQTLRQLGPVSPELEIEDQPALAYRGVMMDFAHGSLLKIGEIKRQIDFLAMWKVNQYYFYNEVSMEMKGYESLNIGAAYTQQEVKEIIDYGRLRQMDVVPFVAFYGHLHDLLKREKYASMGIGKYGEELDPRNPSGTADAEGMDRAVCAAVQKPLCTRRIRRDLGDKSYLEGGRQHRAFGTTVAATP
ncbi:family 20 glycosylhydrolase [Puia sp. P3]|uniref:family 20 glycosylhydrolase n=1 Tax=Puia sp. P3 TaxID=3423952 RepID=UPI003D66F0C1